VFSVFSRFSARRLLRVITVLLPALVMPLSVNASDLRLFDDIYLNDSADDIRSLPDVFDCSDLYNGKLAYCFDQLKVFGLDEEMLAVFLVKQKARSVEYTVPLNAANYNTVLAGLRRKGLVFAHLSVNSETLDVLAGIQLLDRQTLDEQMFVLANRYDYTVPREYMFLESSAFNRAYRHGYNNIEQWLTADLSADGLKKQDKTVTMIVSAEQITVTVSYPFAVHSE